jgi:hypothetical protein
MFIVNTFDVSNPGWVSMQDNASPWRSKYAKKWFWRLRCQRFEMVQHIHPIQIQLRISRIISIENWEKWSLRILHSYSQGYRIFSGVLHVCIVRRGEGGSMQNDMKKCITSRVGTFRKYPLVISINDKKTLDWL